MASKPKPEAGYSLRVCDVARLLGVSKDRVRDLDEDLAPARTGAGHRRYRAADVERVRRQRICEADHAMAQFHRRGWITADSAAARLNVSAAELEAIAAAGELESFVIGQGRTGPRRVYRPGAIDAFIAHRDVIAAAAEQGEGSFFGFAGSDGPPLGDARKDQ